MLTPRTLDGWRLRLTTPADHVSQRGPGYRGRFADPESGQYYDVFGAVCSLPDCYCDAVAVLVPSFDAPQSIEPGEALRPAPVVH